MTLNEFVETIPDLSNWSHLNKIKLFAWFLHTERNEDRLHGADIARCYEAVHLPKASAFGPYISQLENKREILRDAKGLYLSHPVREAFNAKYGQRAITVQIARMLESLPDQVPNLMEKTFLSETLLCLKVGAFHAAIVMAWNLAYHHLCDYILKSPQRLGAFNSQWPSVYQGHHKRGQKAISRMEDFGDELKESEVIEISNSAGIISKDHRKILAEKLGTRNSAAHPSTVKMEQLQAEEFVDNLVKKCRLEAYLTELSGRKFKPSRAGDLSGLNTDPPPRNTGRGFAPV